jgi:hypothetical protein
MAKLIIRNRYGTAPDALLRRRDLSWKAKGLYVYIQSKPEDWDFAIERMEGSDGKDSTRAGIRELENHGYLLRRKVRQNDGTWDIQYTLFESPHRYCEMLDCVVEIGDCDPDIHGGKPATA